MTDETEGDPMVEFASGGAKNYGFKTRGGRWNVKCVVLHNMFAGQPC